MKNTSRNRLCVLAIDPASRGLGFALLEGPESLIDWGFRNAREKKDMRMIKYLRILIENYKPDVLVLEALDSGKSHRSPRIRHLLNTFSSLAAKKGVPCKRVSREEVRTVFLCRNKYRIAWKLASCFPETKPLCPPQRKIWRPEDPRINVFDALALACTYFAVGGNNEQELHAA